MVGGIIMAVSVWVLGRQRQYYLIAPTMGVWGYAVLAGLTPSVTRAAIMFTVYMATRLLGRQRRVLPPLALAAAVMLAIDPEIIASISFQLSFVAVLGIALFSGRFAGRSGDWVQNSTRLPKLTKRPLIGAMYGASVSLAATIATAPLIAFHFGEIPIWGIPSTLLIVPVLPLFLAGSVLAAIAGLVTAQPVAISGLLAHAMGGYMSWVSEMFASTPIGPLDASGWSLPLIVGWYAIVLLLLNRRAAFEMSIKTINLFKKKNSNSSPVVRRENFLEGRAFVSVIAIWAVAAISFLGFVWSEPESTNLTVTFFETNRGDMIFVESPSGARLLVDAGDDSDLAVRNLESVLPALDHRIDLLLSTHPDADHLGGLQRIVERFDVGSIIDSGVNHDSNIYQSWAQMLDDDDRVTIAEAGMVVALDQDVRLRILQTRCVFVECSNFNDEGVVARLEFGEVSFLLTGDMTSGGEIDLLQTGQMVNSSVLKVGHHGSRTSTTRQFLDAVEPALAIVTTGVKNQFGHPHEDVIVRLTNQLGGDLVYITRNNGTITATTNGQRVWVATER
jgi:competence protein ComEC